MGFLAIFFLRQRVLRMHFQFPKVFNDFSLKLGHHAGAGYVMNGLTYFN